MTSEHAPATEHGAFGGRLGERALADDTVGLLERYREPSSFEGASVYPACQNLLLAARALGYGAC